MNDFDKQPFYSKLNLSVIYDTKILMLNSKSGIYAKRILQLGYIISLIILLLNVPSIFTKFNLNNLIQLSFACLITTFFELGTKSYRDTYEKNKSSFRNTLSEPICCCNNTCNCKNDLLNHLKKNKIDLLS